jgi:predicted metallopeptidase
MKMTKVLENRGAKAAWDKAKAAWGAAPVAAQPESESKYRPADEVADLIADIVSSERSDLADAVFAALFRAGKWASKNKETWGSAKKMPTDIKAALGEDIDYIITINEDVWKALADEQKRALVAHELAHCWRDESKKGDSIWSIAGHDVEEFFSILRQYGNWNHSITKTLQALHTSRQISFDFSDAEEMETAVVAAAAEAAEAAEEDEE